MRLLFLASPYNKDKFQTLCLHVRATGFPEEFSMRLKSKKILLKKTLRLHLEFDGIL